MATPPNAKLDHWNRMDREAAIAAILPCNGSQAWAAGVANRAPFATPEQLLAASDDVWRGLGTQDQQQAFDSHPRIGELHAAAATAQSMAWSRGEQSQAQADSVTASALAEANREYEAKFGRIFLICATGRTAPEILARLQQRLSNDASTELREAGEQQRQITQLRLRKWLDEPAEAPAQ